MKREIKFRAKAINNDFFKGAWVDGYYTKRLWDEKLVDVITDGAHEIPIQIETLGQFTGLCDKNGIEIYEGDIINVNGKYPRLVKFIDEYACFCIARISDLDNNLETGYWQQVIPGWWNNPDREIEVCGNIYDNPDLLKGDK